MRKIIHTILFCLVLAGAVSAQKAAPVAGGELDAVGKEGRALGACPLKNTDVQAEISGFISRVRVTQKFENNFSEKIEAVYVFPLPQNAAVDDMTMRIGERTVRGKIMQREEAREVYEAAKSNGRVASLLDQERPNIFTQAVANILPGEKVTIEISYVETLKYEDGSYEFMFPMTVGPRYISGGQGGSPVNDASGTGQVPDASKITPPVAKDRAGHDISIRVRIDAGVPVDSVTSKSHEIESAMLSPSSYDVKLKNDKTIPNKDFILRYDVAGKKIEDAVLTHRDGNGNRGGYFTMILQPPGRPEAKDITPKEIVFVLDTSGSMDGFPIDKAKESMKMALDGLNPQDTFNLITFAGDTSVLFEKPVPATEENLKKAQAFLATRQGGGGTEMMKAIKTALDPSDAQDHLRIVCFMTDGYVGNDNEIIAEIQQHPNARVFSFGIGGSVNRFLLDKMAAEGRGDVEYVSLTDDGSAAAKRFYERVRSPLLTDISLDFGGLKVEDVYPKRAGDLFSAKPLIIHGRFTQPGSGVIKLKGRSFGREVVREIPVNFPENEAGHEALATLWARTRIDDLTSQNYTGSKEDIKSTITNLGIEYRLLTQYTSFVAVEEQVVTDGGQPRRIEVPVELPEGVSREGIFGADGQDAISLQTGSAIVNARQAKFSAARKSKDYKNTIRAIGPSSATGLGTGSGATAAATVASEETGQVDARSVKAELKKTYDQWLEKDVSYIITGEEKRAAGLVIKSTVMPKPLYPAPISAASVANAAKIAVPVSVEVTIDPANGSVLTAKAVPGATGRAAFYKSAEAAAMGAKFEIPHIGRDIVKITGNIAYNFTKDKKVETAQQLLNAQITVKPNKYSVAVRALVERIKANQLTGGGGDSAAGEAKFVAAGRANIIIRVNDLKPETVAALKSAGLEVVAEMALSNAVVGRIAIEKIAALADLDAVTFISPQN